DVRLSEGRGQSGQRRPRELRARRDGRGHVHRARVQRLCLQLRAALLRLFAGRAEHFDGDAILEEYVGCRWEPSQKFIDDPTTTARVRCRHAFSCIVSATLTGDPEEYSQQMGAQARVLLNQFGVTTDLPVSIQVSGK